VWGTSADHIYVVGVQSTVLRWDGTQWEPLAVDPLDVHNFHGVHGTGPDDVYLASEYIGPASSAVTNAASATPRGLVAQGAASLHAGGLILHWNGTPPWTPVYQTPIHDVLSVWLANPGEGFATGNGGSLLRNAAGDAGWVRIWDLTGLPDFVSSVWGSSMRNVFVVGDNGAIARLSP
jgi:photosystem II stability/assembly factor-like uncharacterized protein